MKVWGTMRARKGFTLMEVFVVIATVSVLFGIIMCVIFKCKEASQAVTCASNLRQIATGMRLYSTDHDEAFPMSWDPSTNLTWAQVLTGSRGVTPYADPKLFKCPALNGVSAISYGMTSLSLWYPTLRRTDSDNRFFTQTLRRPSGWPLVLEADNIVVYDLSNPIATAPSDSRFAARHNGHADVLMTDGHVEQAQYGDTQWSQANLNDGSYY